MIEAVVEQINPVAIIFGGLPGYFFFSTYSLLVLFWYVHMVQILSVNKL